MLVFALFQFKKWSFFTHFPIIRKCARARKINFGALYLACFSSKTIENGTKMFSRQFGIQRIQTWRNLHFRTRCARNYARACAHGRKIFKCLKLSETYRKLVSFGFWAFLNFDARVRARRCAHTCVVVYLFLRADLKFMCTKFEGLIHFR